MALSANERRIVELVLKATGDAELKRMTAELRATREAAQSSQKALSGMSGGLSVLGNAAKGFLAGLGVSTIIAWTRAIFEAGDALDAAAEQAGIGVDRYQTLKEAFRNLEVDAGKFETGMERLSSTLSDVLAGGTGKATDALNDLGIAAKIYSGEIRTTDELVDALAASQKAMADDMRFTSDVVAILGRKMGVDYANALRDGKLASEEAALAAEGFTGITKDQIAVLADANEAFDHFRVEATNAILGFVADSISGFALFGSAFGDFVTQVWNGKGVMEAAQSAADNQFVERDQRIALKLGEVAGAWWAPGRTQTDRTRVAPPPPHTPPAKSQGESAAEKAAREQAAQELKDYNDQLDREHDIIVKVTKDYDDQEKALSDYRFALERAADPMIELNAEMTTLIANQDKLSDGAFRTEFDRITAAINQARNAMFESSEGFAENMKAMEAHQKQVQAAREEWEYLAQAFGQATYDVVSGSVKIGQAVKQMVASILAEVARLAAIKLAAQIVGALFGSAGVGKSSSALGTGALKVFANAAGGITSGPVAFSQGGGIGIAGEAGREVIAPLRRDGAGNMGVGAVAPRVVVNNYAGADVGVRQTSDGVQIDIVRRAIANDIRRGGNAVSAAIEGTYRVGRGSQAFG